MPSLRNRMRRITKEFSKFKEGIMVAVMTLSAFSMRNNSGFLPGPIQVFFSPNTIHMEKDGKECNGKCKEQKEVSVDKASTNDGSNYQEQTGVILDLEEVVKKRALYFYKAQQKSFFKRKPVIEVDWSNVKFCPLPDKYMKYTKLVDREEVFRVTSKMVFENKTSIDQHHKLKANRQTASVCNSTLTEGYTKGLTIGLSLPVPLETGILTKFTLDHIHGNKDEESSTSLVENHIKVPKESIVAVSTLINKKETICLFRTFIHVQGNVKAIFYDQKNKNIGSIELPMSTIIFEEFPKRMTRKENCIKIKGTCNFEYRVDKNVVTPTPVNINDRPLTSIYIVMPFAVCVATLCMFAMR